jgi:hypothetical protein
MAPERALRELASQLDALQNFKNRDYNEAHADEKEWDQLTFGIIEAAFGNPSTALQNFRSARFAGQHHTGYTSREDHQSNFQARVRAYEATLRSQINLLRMQLPEEEIKGMYEPGEEYAFYRDLSSLFAATTQEIFIIDAYLDEKVFDLYVEKVPGNAKVRLLSNKIGGKVETVAKMYVSRRPLELRSTTDVHDRMVFFDQRGWLIGQSIKDAARKKPTYLVELDEPLLTAARNIYNQIWAAATIINLGSP